MQLDGRGVERLIRRDLLAVEGYSAPASLEELRARFGERLTKVDQNENPYGCSPRVLEALGTYGGYHAYPDILSREVRELLSAYLSVPAERVVVGNGSDEIIELLLRLVIDRGDKVISCPPTFGYYRFASEVAGAVVEEVVRRDDFSLDIGALRAACCDQRVRIVFVASPNNPTGNQIAESDIRELLDVCPLLAVDEAYAEFAHRDVIGLTHRYENLVVVRTFSKWAGLAGLRAGYGIVPEVLAPHINRIKPPFNVNVAAQVAMKASLLDLPHLRDVISRIVAERERMQHELAKLAFLRPWPSQANFIFCHVIGADARRIKAQLEEEGILVRIYDDPLLRNALRFSVGTPAQNNRLLDQLRAMAVVPA